MVEVNKFTSVIQIASSVCGHSNKKADMADVHSWKDKDSSGRRGHRRDGLSALRLSVLGDHAKPCRCAV